MISKIDLLFSNIFEEGDDGLKYLPDNFNMTEVNCEGIPSAKRLRQNILILRRQFQNEQRRILDQQGSGSRVILKGKRIPSRESFEIIEGKNVNLRAVHNLLTNEDHPFIDPHTNYDQFEALFSGNPVRIKVDWLQANALHYFIDRIHGIGIKRANEGQWVRASKCFTVNRKDLTPDQIKDAGNPVSSVTILFEGAIRPFL